MQEALLIQHCIKGDRAAQRRLFDTYYKYVYTICYRYVNHHQDAEDVVSEVFRRVFKYLHKVTNSVDQGLKKWIQTIAINESIRFLNKRQPIDYTEDLFLEHNLLSKSEDEVSSTISDSDIEAAKQIVNAMPTGYRTIFLLNIVEGLSHTEIAEHLGISRNTSKSQMLKARKYLKNKLNKDASRQI